MKRFEKSNRKRGIALVMILFLMALLAVMVVGMLLLARAESRSSDAYVSTIRTDQLTEIVKSSVISQIRRGTQFDPEKNIAWASQPGALRSYGENGGFHTAFKLYSDSIMEESSERMLAGDSPPVDWDQNPDHYVDLNSPVIRTRQDGELHTYFPIFDPRAFHDDPDTVEDDRIEGFSYSDTINRVVVGEEDPEKLRLPMPVEWLYVLRDGTLGVLDEEGRFQPQERVSETNPMVGRIAFWTDDESCKINVNTASEPTYWSVPSLADRADWGWAKMQPGKGEYQRFPGHPATTALSPVLMPNQVFADAPSPDLNTGKFDETEVAAARKSASEKGKLYDWAPKIQDIGSQSGSVLMNWRIGDGGSKGGINGSTGGKHDKIVWYPESFDPFSSAREHLYVSIDEYLLDPDRQERDFSFTGFTEGKWGRVNQEGESSVLVNEERLRIARSFITANSRAPETTLFGTPRIAMWPMHSEPGLDSDYRTHFDELIARCATLGKMAESRDEEDNSYYFRREDSRSSTTDIELKRNRELLDYLQELTDRRVPGFGRSFASKYGDDRDQILVQMFDYIRSTNLFDAIIADRVQQGLTDWNYTTFTDGKKLAYRRGEVRGVLQYSPWHKFQNGHGAVTPSYKADWDAKGFGRAPTVSEVAMQFICVADGTASADNPYKDDPEIPDPWKGGPRAQATTTKNGFVYGQYSNFPPLSDHLSPYGPREGNDHPGYHPANWNHQLEKDEPLPPGRKRIQGMLHIDLFNIAPGFNMMKGRYGFRVKKLTNLTVDGQPLFPVDEVEQWHTYGSARAHWEVRNGLRHYPNRPDDQILWAMGKPVRARFPMPEDADPKFGSKTDSHGRYTHDPATKPWIELVTNFIDVNRDSMSFGSSGPIEIELLVWHDDDDPVEVLQTIVVDVPSSTIASPNLPLDSKNFWSFYRHGYNMEGGAAWPNNTREDGTWPNTGRNRGGRQALLTTGRSPYTFKYIRDDYDVVFSMVPWHGDYRLLAGQRRVDEDPASPSGKVFVPHPGAPSGSKLGEHSFGHFEQEKTKPNETRNALFQGGVSLAGLNWGNRWQVPQFPKSLEAITQSSRYGDFDIGVGSTGGGAFINKPDEGNLNFGYYMRDTDVPYFDMRFDTYAIEARNANFSPNRIVSSPALMGSLPSGVKAQDPWRTLIFRPHVNQGGSAVAHPGQATPPDHLLLDLFWMPVVEPYPISEPFSTAGKINLNYQILPFTHIRRATGLHALFKGERVAAVPSDALNYLGSGHPGYRSQDRHLKNRVMGKMIYRPIDAEETLEAFDRRFNTHGTLFRSASQICEMHLVPEVISLPPGYNEGSFPNEDANTETRMKDFWTANRGTGDNLRERPYANLYSRVTTQTNTWRIHYRVQRLKKSLGADAKKFDSGYYTPEGEQRGSMLLERYIDPNDPRIPDFASDPTESLDLNYQFRILSTRRFAL